MPRKLLTTQGTFRLKQKNMHNIDLWCHFKSIFNNQFVFTCPNLWGKYYGYKDTVCEIHTLFSPCQELICCRVLILMTLHFADLWNYRFGCVYWILSLTMFVQRTNEFLLHHWLLKHSRYEDAGTQWSRNYEEDSKWCSLFDTVISCLVFQHVLH